MGVDCKRVEFNLLRGVKGVKGVALDVKSAADTVAAFQQIMMDRFKFMEQSQVFINCIGLGVQKCAYKLTH